MGSRGVAALGPIAAFVLGGASATAIALAVHNALDDPDIGYVWIMLALAFALGAAIVLRWWWGLVRVRQGVARLNEWVLHRLGRRSVTHRRVEDGDDWP